MNRHARAAATSPPRARPWRDALAAIGCAALLVAITPAPLAAQTTSSSTGSSTETQGYSAAQLDALLAPVALYPDQLLTQILMACSYPLDVVEAERWLQQPGNAKLTGDALDKALAAQSWDPSVKSLVPFPQILSMMNDQLNWMQQVGYAMSTQQSDVWASVQRLRHQAQQAGNLKSTAQQTVTTQGQTIIIAPTQPTVVYVPTYNPTVVYGSWAYPAYPPVYLPPPPGYYAGTALVAGLAFGVGVAVSASLWGWARPNWGYGNTYVNVNRYNTINVNRTVINNSTWRAPPPPAGGYRPPPGGPVGHPAGGALRPPPNNPGHPYANNPGHPPGTNPARPPANRPNEAGNRPPGPPGGANHPNVNVPGNVTRPPPGMGPNSQYPGITHNGATRPETGNAPGGQRPAFKPPSGGGFEHGGSWSGRPSGAFGGMGDGRNASEFGNRGAQSRDLGGMHGGGGMHAGGFGQRRQ